MHAKTNLKLVPKKMRTDTKDEISPLENTTPKTFEKMNDNVPMQSVTAAQVTHMPPEVPAKYDIERLKQIGSEAQRQCSQEVLQDVVLNPQQHAEMVLNIRRLINEMAKLGKVLGRWYNLTRDDARAKMYFKLVGFVPYSKYSKLLLC